MNKKNFPAWKWDNALQYKYIPILGYRKEALRELFFECMRKNVIQNEDIIELPWKGWEYSAILELGPRRAEEFMDASGNQKLEGAQFDALVRIINKCRENNINVLLTTAPTLPCFYEGFDADFLEKFYEDMKYICDKYDLRYIDYTGDRRFPADSLIFSDTDHMTKKGAKFFTEQFLEDNIDCLPFKLE